MPIDKVAIYRAELKPPTGWTQDEAKKYQRSMLIPDKLLKQDSNIPGDIDIPAYPFLGTLMAPAPGQNKVLTLSTDDDDIIARGDKILRLLSKSDPVSYDTVKTLLDKIPMKPGYIKPLSPSTVQTPPGTPVVQKVKRIKPSGPKMIIKQDFETYQSTNLDDYFYSPFGDITGPPDLKALHVGIKAAGIRKLIAINSMSNEYVERDNIEYDLRRYLAGLPTRYINQIRFNKALAVASKTKTETDSITVKSYHKITGVRQEKVETLTLNHKQWLLKGRAYDSNVLTALYPPHDKRFGYELWKIWASSMQKRLDRYMSQYTKPVNLGKGKPGPAYPTKQTIQTYKPLVRKTAVATQKQTPIIPLRRSTRKKKPPATTTGTAVPIVTAIPIYNVDDTVHKVLQEAGASVPEITLAIKTLINDFSNAKTIRIYEFWNYIAINGLPSIQRSPEITEGLNRVKKTVDENLSDYNDRKDKMNNFDNGVVSTLQTLTLRGNSKRNYLKDTNKYTFYDSGDDSVAIRNWNPGSDYTDYRKKVVIELCEQRVQELVDEEENKYKTNTYFEIDAGTGFKIARVSGVADRILTFTFCADETATSKSIKLDNLVIRPGDPADCFAAEKKISDDQVAAQQAAAADKIAEQKKKEEEERKRKEAEDEALRKQAEEEALRKQVEEERKKMEAEAKAKRLGKTLTLGTSISQNPWTELKDGNDVKYMVKFTLDVGKDDDDEKFKVIRDSGSVHLAKYWYIKSPKMESDKVLVTLDENINFDTSIDVSRGILICEYAGPALADADDRCIVPICNEIVDSAIAAVQAIHDAGFIHGDVKLENMCYKDGIVKLIDFGDTKSFKQKLDMVESFIFYTRQKERVTLIEDPSLGTMKAGDYIKGAGKGTFSKFTPGYDNPTLDELKSALAGSLLKGSQVYGQSVDSIKEALENTDVILYGRNKFLAEEWKTASLDLYQGNGYTIISPPFTEDPVFGDIDMAERFRLHDKWALTMAMLHLGTKHMKPVPDPDTIEPSQVLSALLFNDDDKSWFSLRNKQRNIPKRFTEPLSIIDDEERTLLKLLSLIIKGDPRADMANKQLSTAALKKDLKKICKSKTFLKDLTEAWITGHYKLEDTATGGFEFTPDQLSPIEQTGDLGETYYGVPSSNIVKLFQPLYNAIQPGASSGSPVAARQSLFDYDSFSDAELDELSTEMEALDDEELEKLINDEMSYNSSSDSGRSNVVYDSSSDTGRSNVAYDSSSDTGNSNAAYSYNSESEQSAAESYNNDSYNSDSDEDK